MNTWFRFYHEVLDDPKVQSLSPELFKNWVNMLCVAGRHGGVLPPLKDICFYLRINSELAQSILDSLLAVKLFDKRRNGTFVPHNWDARQFKSDSSTERVKRFRKRHSNGAVTTDGTPPETETDIPPIVPPFDAFWKAYPHKVGKAAARKAWDKLKPKPPLDVVLAAIERAKHTPNWKAGEFIPNPATWLNQGRWEDEPATPGQKPRSVHDFL